MVARPGPMNRTTDMYTTKVIGIAIPRGVTFADLELVRNPLILEVKFSWAPIEAICQENGLDPTIFQDDCELNLAFLLNGWYAAHRASGGAPDLVAEQLLAESEAELCADDPARVICHAGGLQ